MNTFGIALITFAAVCTFPACYAVPLWNSLSSINPTLLATSSPVTTVLATPSSVHNNLLPLNWLNSCLSPATSLALNGQYLQTSPAIVAPSLSLPSVVDPCLDGGILLPTATTLPAAAATLKVLQAPAITKVVTATSSLLPC